MLKKSFLAVLCLLLVGPAGSALAKLDPSLVVYWPLDEGAGAVANDASGNGNNGAISGTPTWVSPGKIGSGALQFGGSNQVLGPHIALNQQSFTIAFWINPTLPSGSQIMFSEVQSSSTDLSMHLRIGGASSTDSPTNGIRFGFYSDDLDSPSNIVQTGNWYHLTFWYDWGTKARRIYLNGTQIANNTSATGFLATTGSICLGSWTGSAYYTGLIDDFQLYQKALSDAEIRNIMAGLSDKALAVNVSPEDGATDVPRDATLNWTAGEFPANHDVYFGTTFTDVNNASRTNAMGVLASRGQTATTYDPTGVFAYGQTYYWRIDEVNQSPDQTIFKGETWSFTAEPYGYPVTPIAATASSSQPNMGPENTINGSGLDKSGLLHGTEPTTMWMSAGVQPNWIQYEFDRVYKLYQMQVWNSNQLIEAFLGFGAKTVTIETSLDGATWTPLADVPQFAQAPGAPNYAANTTVSFGGVEAKYVKLNITANWGGVAPQTGLAEVRFSYIPVQAREPEPATDATGVAIDTSLNWRPGREAGSHQVFFGTDPNALPPATTVSEHSYTPASLNFGTKYYWQVDEVNTVTYRGDVWNFTTQDYAVIDDFESYTDQPGEEIFSTWIDGLTTGLSGSTVGYLTATNGTFGETTIVHGGKQSMPLAYDNTKAPFVSEAERTFDTAQNWTTNGADRLVVYFRGMAPAFAETASGSILMNAIGTDIWGTADQFRFAYKTLTGDGTMVARVDSIFNSNTWAKGGVMIRQNTVPGSVHAFMPITPGGGNGASFQRRPTAGAASANSDNTGAVVAAPYWVKIERKGSNFSGYISPDGKTWTQLGTAQTIAMTDPVLIGLALCSHDAAIPTAATFSNISTTGNVTGAWQVAEIGATQPEGNSVEGLYLAVKDSSGKTKVVQYPDPAATAYMAWTPWTIPLSDFTAAGVKMNAVKSLLIGVGDKAAPKAGGTGTVYIDDIGFGHPAQ